MRRTYLFTLGMVCVAATPYATAQDTSLSLETLAGYDSNPYLWADTFNPEGDFFLDLIADASLSSQNGFSLRGNYNRRIYANESDADRTTMLAELRYRGRSKIGGLGLRYGASLRYTDYDKTFISRNTGLPGVFGGESVTDRYDSNWIDATANVEFRFNKKLRFDLLADMRDRSYTDYTALNMPNLDYSRWGVRARATFKPNDSHTLRASYRFRQLDFDDRLGRDLTRALIPDTNLSFDFHILEASWAVELNDKTSVTTSAYLENRVDKISGYYDTTWQRYRIRFDREFSNRSELQATLTYRDYIYDNNDVLADIEGEEPINSKTGFQYELSYNYALSSSKNNRFWVVSKVSYEDFDSVSANFVYDKAVVWLGLHAKL